MEQNPDLEKEKDVNYKDFPLKNIYDSDLYTETNSVFVLKKKTKEELLAEPRDERKKTYLKIPSHTNRSTGESNQSYDSDSNSQISRKSDNSLSMSSSSGSDSSDSSRSRSSSSGGSDSSRSSGSTL